MPRARVAIVFGIFLIKKMHANIFSPEQVFVSLVFVVLYLYVRLKSTNRLKRDNSTNMELYMLFVFSFK